MKNEISLLVKKVIEKNSGTAWDLCNYLTKHPETAFTEFESSKKIVSVLIDAGFEVEYPYMGLDTAFKAEFDNGDGPVVGILTEYDALPGIGHACGHNLHGSLSVLCALALKELAGLYTGKLVVFGTPGEEGGGGKVNMAEGGAFDGLSLAMMMHSYSGEASEPNMATLSMRFCSFEFHGKPSHAIQKPWNGRSALAAARKFLDLIDANRECFMPGMRAYSIITNGGQAVNIIPALAEAEVEFRAEDPEVLEELDKIINRCAVAAALALDCTVSVTKKCEDFDNMLRIPALESEITAILEGLGKKVRGVSPPMASSDVGNVSYCCPAIQPLLSVTEESFPLHTVEFAQAVLKPEAKASMLIGAEALTLIGLKIFRDSAFREKVQEEFRKAAAFDKKP